MKKLYALSIILLSGLSFAQTPISLIGMNIPYNEDFSGMGPTQTSYIPGWTAININDGATLQLGVTNGSASVGNAYNVGTTDSEERAFATLADATVTPALGAVFVNNTGSTVSKISIQTRMEQWKESGNASVNETVALYYSLNATSLNTGTWTAVTALDLKEKLITATTNNAVNGNLSANYTNMASLITGINWANNSNLWIKWSDTNDAGSNGMFAIENFSISVAETLGIKENTIAGLKMYPNPVSDGTLHITSASNEAKSVNIYDSLGKQVLTSNISNSNLNVSTLKAGTYFVKITEDVKTDTKKLIVK